MLTVDTRGSAVATNDALVIASWLLAVFVELPYHLDPSLHSAATRSITILGDSVTAGTGGDERSERWPSLLARQHQMKIQDVSHVGETAGSALDRIRSHEIRSALVVLEIGGNDILGSTTVARFERDLEALIGYLAAPDRQLIMFELPLPPFFHKYGRVQRKVAARHHVQLIPKRVLLSVIADPAATLDTIHLTQAGHRQMADAVWQSVGSAFSQTDAEHGGRDGMYRRHPFSD